MVTSQKELNIVVIVAQLVVTKSFVRFDVILKSSTE